MIAGLIIGFLVWALIAIFGFKVFKKPSSEWDGPKLLLTLAISMAACMALVFLASNA